MSLIRREEEVLRLLKDAEGYVSGEAIAQELNISRAAVWKHISKLRRDGFHIDAQPRSGYCLITSPDKLTPSQIRDGLKTSLVGREIFYYQCTESTNTIAKKMAMDGAKDGTVFVAEEQTSGRGRLNRHWISPANKNILMSIVFRPDLPATQVFSLTMITSLAIVRAIMNMAPLTPRIKWPNDIYIGNKKIGGILTEFNGDQDGVNFVVVGAGLNVNFDPRLYPEIAENATSMKNELGREVSRTQLLQSILREIEKCYGSFNEGGISEIRSEWNTYSLITGKTVQVTSFGNVETGVAESVDKDGCLILRDSKGQRKRIFSGDVSLRFDG